MKLVRNIAIGIVALLLSMVVTVAIPLVNYLVNHQESGRPGPRVVAQVGLKQLDAARPAEQPRRKLKQPQRAKPMQTNVKAGPRFAMDLGVGGLEGAAVSVDIVNRPSGGGGNVASDDGDVDERPNPNSPPPFRTPDGVKSAERDAYTVVSFCVDPSGRAYDVRVVEEKPAGLGMGQAARDALRQTTFSPARKAGAAVAFCGLEQPFEVKFGN
jgi:protein TonB